MLCFYPTATKTCKRMRIRGWQRVRHRKSQNQQQEQQDHSWHNLLATTAKTATQNLKQVLNIRHELVHFNPVIFLFNSVSKTFPCKNVISRFVSYLKWTEALKPEIIFTSPETGNKKQKSWTTEALLRPARKGIWKSWELGFTSHTAAGEVEGSWCPVSAERRSCPCRVKLLPSSKRQVSQQPTKS